MSRAIGLCDTITPLMHYTGALEHADVQYALMAQSGMLACLPMVCGRMRNTYIAIRALLISIFALYPIDNFRCKILSPIVQRTTRAQANILRRQKPSYTSTQITAHIELRRTVGARRNIICFGAVPATDRRSYAMRHHLHLCRRLREHFWNQQQALERIEQKGPRRLD